MNVIGKPVINAYDELLSSPLEQFNFSDPAYDDGYQPSPSVSSLNPQTVLINNPDKDFTELKNIMSAQEIKLDNLTNEIGKISTKLEKLLSLQVCGSYMEQIGTFQLEGFNFPITCSEAVLKFNQFCCPENKEQLQNLVS